MTHSKYSFHFNFVLFTISVCKKDFVDEMSRKNKKEFFSFINIMLPGGISVPTKPSQSVRRSRPMKSSADDSAISDQLIAQLLKFRIDGQTINARNVDEVYPGLDRLLLRSLQTGDCRLLYNRFKKNLKPEYLLITGKHIHLSVCSQTQHILEKLIEMGATLGE
jgi:hypothetical protein